jgi:hypothetical protein
MRRFVFAARSRVPVSSRARTAPALPVALVLAAACALCAPSARASGGSHAAAAASAAGGSHAAGATPATGATPASAATPAAATAAPSIPPPPPPPSAPSTVANISEEARAKFNIGVNLLTDPDGPRYEEAYRAFKAAYALSPSYKILGNLGLCAMKLERDDEAIASYEKYLAEGKDLTRPEVQQITSDLATLRSSVAHVVVESDPPGAEIIDVRVPVRGERVLNSYGTAAQSTKLGLHEGSHQVTARLDGYRDQTWDVEVAGGKDLPPHKFVFTKEAPATSMNMYAPSSPPIVISRPVPARVWIGVAATGALAVAAGVTGLLAIGKHSDFDNENDGQHLAAAQDTKNAGQTLNLVNDICLGGAVVAAAVTTVLYVTRPTVETTGSAYAKPTAKRGVVVVPGVARSGAGLNLLGSF